MNERNYLFDAMRGLAAIAVLLFHLGPTVGVSLAPGGYLAVDLFFVLSGYVIQQAYAPRLSAGMGLGRFAEIRLVRLYPLFFVGFALGLARLAGALAMHDPRALSPAALAVSAAFGALLLPTPLSLPTIFPVNPPSWSLSLEAVVNLLFAAGAFRARSGVLAAVALGGAALMIAGAAGAGDLNLGIHWADYYAGLGRALWSFFAGVLLARHGGGALRERGWSWATAFAVAALVAAMAVAPSAGWRLPFDLAAALLLFPLLVHVAARVRVPALLQPAFGLLGDLSYPLYTTHYVLLASLALAAGKLSRAPWVVGRRWCWRAPRSRLAWFPSTRECARRSRAGFASGARRRPRRSDPSRAAQDGANGRASYAGRPAEFVLRCIAA